MPGVAFLSGLHLVMVSTVASVIIVAKTIISSGFDRNYTVIPCQYTVQNVVTYRKYGCNNSYGRENKH